MKRLYTIEDLKIIATQKGGDCLSTSFLKVKDKYLWKCDSGHIWEASFNNILYSKNWCPSCNGKTKGTIEEMQNIALSRNGKCLSKEYTNKKTKLLWECEVGHQWYATPDSIKNGPSWCGECYQPRHNIDNLKKFATDRGGKCLSNTYTNYNANMKWECKFGHQWETPAKYIIKGHWCHICSKILPKDLQHLQEIAESRNGKLLSKEYEGMQAQYEWECGNGHQWAAPAGAVKAGRWCHQCRKISLVELNLIAESKGGKCISVEYLDATSPIKFKCKEGHTFDLLPTNVKNRDAWCTVCTYSINEEKCRFILQSLLGTTFIKTRKILGDSLELDGYCELPNQLRIAFEYHGEQHYKFSKYFHEDAQGFMKQIITDLEKRYRCKELKIELIEIPYNTSMELIDFIKDELYKRNIPYDDQVEVNSDLVYKSKSKIALLQSLAKEFNGELLTKHYNHYATKLDFKCAKGHFFQLKPYEIEVLGQWCKRCNAEERRRLHFEELLSIVYEKEGGCLSYEYINSKTPLIFHCKEGHIWLTIPEVIKKGHWCPDCAITTNRRKKSK